MPVPINIMYQIKAVVLQPSTGMRHEILVDESTNQAAMQTELAQYQATGLLNDGTAFDSILIRENILHNAEEPDCDDDDDDCCDPVA